MLPEKQELAIQRLGDPSPELIEAAQKLGPRNLSEVEKNVCEVVANGTPELAESCVYCKPVGRDENGRQTFSVGPSVRLTEIGQQAFGWLWCNVVVQNYGRRIEAIAKVFDLRCGNIYHATASRSWSRDMPESVVENWINAAASIARRNALLQAMRPQLVRAEAIAKEKVISKWAGGGKIGTEAYTAAFRAIAADYQKRWGTTQEELKDLVKDEGDPADRLWLLIGIRNWLIDNASRYEDVFGRSPRPIAKTTPIDTKTSANTTAANEPDNKKDEETREEKTEQPVSQTKMFSTHSTNATKNPIWVRMVKNMAEKMGMSDEDINKVVKEKTGLDRLEDVEAPRDMSAINEYFLSEVDK